MPKSSFKTIDDLAVSGKRVLVRVDLNVPMKNGQVTDATRIERAMPTLNELAEKGARVVVLSHFGRPDGKRVPEMSLKPLVEPLSKALGKPVAFADDCIGAAAEDAVRALKNGEVLLLENLRFHKEEEKNEAGFIDKLSALGDIYINDAFSAAHRAHASTEGLANRLPAAAGRLTRNTARRRSSISPPEAMQNISASAMADDTLERMDDYLASWKLPVFSGDDGWEPSARGGSGGGGGGSSSGRRGGSRGNRDAANNNNGSRHSPPSSRRRSGSAGGKGGAKDGSADAATTTSSGGGSGGSGSGGGGSGGGGSGSGGGRNNGTSKRKRRGGSRQRTTGGESSRGATPVIVSAGGGGGRGGGGSGPSPTLGDLDLDF